MEQHTRRERPLPSPAHQIETDDRTALVCKPRTKGGNSDLPSAGFNVINSIIGSGIIGLPYSMKQAGFPLGILLLVGVAYITDYSIILLIKGGNLSGTNSYQELVNKSYGFIGYLILSTLQFLYPFIAMISYNIITGDTLTKVFQTIPGVGPDNLLTYRQVIILCITIIFTLPMSLYRDIAKLAKVSFISLILTTVILVIVMIRTTTLGPLVPKTESAWIFAKSNAIQAIGVMSFGDIFENYCRDDDLATFGRFCYGVTIILTFPIECFVTREVIANVFFSGTLTTILHVAVTVIVVAVATSISLVYDCLGIVLELNGILSATPLVFIIPTACYLKLSEERWNHSDNLISGLILTVGVLVMTVGFVMTILHPQECSHGKEMFYCFPHNASLYNSTLPPF
ncbi:putative sodium-coupled neutral amino acid transporter 11 isoform X3 [Caretta caretta]|uniref:putative sodium-coupled neutral amino acid transporter 11 isoform X3 n=1 Tax=Caretta caretta TaxID=8467 RepID=UPI002096193B|nr:putative sodium-coupled neutral amino acid transporter 11 isoform X2 [Caretta caretta]